MDVLDPSEEEVLRKAMEYADRMEESAVETDVRAGLSLGVFAEMYRVMRSEVVRLRHDNSVLGEAIRTHRDQRGDDRCWLDDLTLYAALGEPVLHSDTSLPPREDFLASCERYWQQRQCPIRIGEARMPGGMTIAQLTAEVDRLKKVILAAHVAAVDAYNAHVEPECTPDTLSLIHTICQHLE